LPKVPVNLNNYSEGNFEVFRHAARHVAPMGRNLASVHSYKFHHNRCKDNGIGPKKLKILLKLGLYKISEY